jgi:hypothetical protein
MAVIAAQRIGLYIDDKSINQFLGAKMITRTVVRLTTEAIAEARAEQMGRRPEAEQIARPPAC